MVDGEENPLDTISTMKFHEVQKYLVVSNHGAMEDVVLFNPAWWNRLTPEHRKIIGAAFDEVRPQVEQLKEGVQNASLASIKAANVNVRVSRRARAPRVARCNGAESACNLLERAGAEGGKIMALYDDERKKLGF